MLQDTLSILEKGFYQIIDEAEAVTVGRPIANTKFYVADPFGNPLPVGLKGELIICGDQVGRGYVNLPEKTARAGIHHVEHDALSGPL